jgi:glycine hydroxymethyltransferase
MIASESPTSPLVRTLLSSDFSRRYASGEAYAGSEFYYLITEICEELAKEIFGGKYVDVRAVTGNIAVLAVVLGLTDAGDTVVTTPPDAGGYPIRMADRCHITLRYYSYDWQTMNVNKEEAVDLILQTSPRLVVVGMSEYLFPHPLREIAAAAHQVDALVYYDGSHVMGLIAGGQFADPLREGADILAGSTHKSMSGPQGAVIITNDSDCMEKIRRTLDSPPMLVSSINPARVVATAVALSEARIYGRDYAMQIVKNARALAQSLDQEGVPVLGKSMGYTKSHQVIIDCQGYGSPAGIEAKRLLEQANIIADFVVRFGVQEVTRRGMKEGEMNRIASFIRRVLLDRESPEAVRKDVEDLVTSFPRFHYCLSPNEDSFSLDLPNWGL